MQTEHYNRLSNEQQDHLFDALQDAREAARERWQMELGTPIPQKVEPAVAEQHIEQVKDEAANALAA